MPQNTETRRKELNFGLANNAFGAAAGATGTAAVYRQARAKHLPKREAAIQAKRASRAAARAAKGPSKIGALKTVARSKAKRLVPKRARKYLPHAAIGKSVASQLVNAGADAQSAAFFARERATMGKKAVKKSYYDIGEFDSGMSSGVEIEFGKADKWAERESGRKYRKGQASALMGAGSVASLGYAGKKVADVKVTPLGRQHRAGAALRHLASETRKGTKKSRGRIGAALGASAVLAGGSYQARRMARADGGRRWA